MNDTLDPKLSVETTDNLEQTTTPDAQAPEKAPEVEETQPQDENVVTEKDKTETPQAETKPTVVNPTTLTTKESVIEQLKKLVETDRRTTRTELDGLKQAYFRIRRAEVEEQQKAFLADEGVAEDFRAKEDASEPEMKKLLEAYKEKRANQQAEEERLRAANYALKLQLIEELKNLSESQEDFNKLYNEFKNVQARWKEAKDVPQEHAADLWKNYQIYSERFYDIIKINNEFRDYDFKKNLGLKTQLCEAVERLAEESDVISAFHQLQKLHQQWREIGPVARNLREELWLRFKAGSTSINKKHQQHFEELKTKEKDNLVAKTAICEEMEAIDYTLLKTYKEWDKKNKEVLALQAQWKTIGFAPKKQNIKIFERFRTSCDLFFGNKSNFYKAKKKELEENLAKKRALCEKVNALKDSTEWKDTTEELITIQKEWKTIGPVARKHSDLVWKEFIAACDYFFEQKNKNVPSQRVTEQNNFKAKKELIAKIDALNEMENDSEALQTLHALLKEWNTIGHIPYKEKDKVYKLYREAADKQFDRLKVSQNDRRMQDFRSNLSEMGSGKGKSNNRIYSERDKLIRIMERIKSELQTYENNMGFLNISSKSGGGLLVEMQRKIENLKNEMVIIKEKIKAIDDNLDQ